MKEGKEKFGVGERRLDVGELCKEIEEGRFGILDDGFDEFGGNGFGFDAGVEEVLEEMVDFYVVASGVRVEELAQGLGLGQAKGVFEELGGDSLVGEGGDLIENTERITERAAAAADDKPQRVIFDRDFFGVGDFAEVVKHCFRVSKTKSMDLGAGGNGDWDLVGVGGRHDKDDVLGRFLEGFEEGVGGGFGQHVNLVDDVDFVFPFRRGDDGFFAEFADVVDAGV